MFGGVRSLCVLRERRARGTSDEHSPTVGRVESHQFLPREAGYAPFLEDRWNVVVFVRIATRLIDIIAGHNFNAGVKQTASESARTAKQVNSANPLLHGRLNQH